MQAEIISIGTELLLGHIVNTNASFLSKKLAELGIDVYYQTTVGDNPERLARLIRQALSRSDIVITSGGLGPTIDDITIETLAKLLNKKLILNKAVLKDLDNHFKLRGIKTPKDSIRQAYVPRGINIIRNNVGTAPGLIAEDGGKVIICLPGPPREIEPMFQNDIMPYLEKRFAGLWTIKSRIIKIAGLAESQVNARVKDLLNLKPPTTVGIYAKLGEVDLKIMAKSASQNTAARAIEKIEKKIDARLKGHIFGYDDETLESVAGRLLTEKKKTIAIAESCTGGLVSNRITDVSGSSKCFLMGVITYSNESKENILGISQRLIQKRGAVSKEVALEMAKGVKVLARSDISIGLTGIAGPTGGTKTKPVGLVYIALVTDKKKIVREFRFKGSRQEIKFQASQAALEMVRRNV